MPDSAGNRALGKPGGGGDGCSPSRSYGPRRRPLKALCSPGLEAPAGPEAWQNARWLHSLPPDDETLGGTDLTIGDSALIHDRTKPGRPVVRGEAALIPQKGERFPAPPG